MEDHCPNSKTVSKGTLGTYCIVYIHSLHNEDYVITKLPQQSSVKVSYKTRFIKKNVSIKAKWQKKSNKNQKSFKYSNSPSKALWQKHT